MEKARGLEGMAFEEAIGELERLVQGMERGEMRLEESIEAYRRAKELAAHCEALIKDAETKIEAFDERGAEVSAQNVGDIPRFRPTRAPQGAEVLAQDVGDIPF